MTKTMKVLMPTALALFISSAAHAGVSFDTPQGKLNIGGDVELDLTAADNSSNEAVDAVGGRVLLDVNGEHVRESGTFAGFKVNPLYKFSPAQTSNVSNSNDVLVEDARFGLDDVWFAFGQKNDWSAKIGRFEAYDLSPAGQDTYVADGGFATGFYRANIGRGRAQSQFMVNKEMGSWYAEVAAMFDQTPGVYGDEVKEKDPLLVRPVLAYKGDGFSIAAGAELPVVQDAYVRPDGSDGADWQGYGLTGSFNVAADTTLTLRGAYLDATGFSKYSAGPGLQYKNFYAAYLFGNKNFDGATPDVDSQVAYASYKIPAIMDIDNFDMYLGASWGDEDNVDEEFGGRVRFKYFF